MINKEKSSKKKKIGLFVVCAAITVFVLIIFLSVGDISAIFETVSQVDINYLLIAIGVLLLYAILSPLSLCILAKSNKTQARFGDVYVVGMTEHFFNGITPFSTGGQPFQVYAFNRLKVKPSESTGLLLMNFIIFMLVTNAFAICSLFFYNDFVSDSSMSAFAIVGFCMNFLVLAFMLMLATSKKMSNLLVKAMALVGRIKFLKKLIEPRIPTFQAYCEQVQVAFKTLLKNQGMFWLCFFVRVITMAVYYGMTFFILKSLHIDIGWDQIYFVIFGTSFAITTAVFLPTPGSSGGIEYAFRSVFASLTGASVVVATSGMLLWRLLSYYLLMIFSLLFYILFETAVMRRFKRCHPESVTVEETTSTEQITEEQAVPLPDGTDDNNKEPPTCAEAECLQEQLSVSDPRKANEGESESKASVDGQKESDD